MDSGPHWTEVAQAIFVGMQLVVLVVAALFARRQLNEAQRLREDQIRPFVVIDLDSPHKPFFDLVVKNIGTTMARDVTFEFDPAPGTTIEGAELDKLKIFRDGISTLPPGKEIRTLFDSGITRSKADLPDVYEVTVRYRGPTGAPDYAEKIDLDFGLYWGRKDINRRDIHDVHKELKGIGEEIKKWTSNVDGGLLRVTPDDVARSVEQVQREIAERRQQAESE